MSPLARALLALAAAALLHAAAAEQCGTDRLGHGGNSEFVVLRFETDQTDSVHELPGDECPDYSVQVGVMVTACDPYGNAPRVELLDYRRVRVTCTWTDGQTCPHHLNAIVIQNCQTIL